MSLQPKAKEVRRYVDKMITLAKRGTDHAKMQANAWVYDRALVDALFEKVHQRYGQRKGGYCRVIGRTRYRRGDAAQMALLSLVESDEEVAQMKAGQPAEDEEAAPAQSKDSASDAAAGQAA